MKVAPAKLTAARHAAKLSQVKAADAAGVHFTTYNRYERGHLELRDIGKIIALAGAFGVGDFTTLLEEENGGDPDEEEAALLRLSTFLADVSLLSDLVARVRAANEPAEAVA